MIKWILAWFAQFGPFTKTDWNAKRRIERGITKKWLSDQQTITDFERKEAERRLKVLQRARQ